MFHWAATSSKAEPVSATKVRPNATGRRAMYEWHWSRWSIGGATRIDHLSMPSTEPGNHHPKWNEDDNEAAQSQV